MSVRHHVSIGRSSHACHPVRDGRWCAHLSREDVLEAAHLGMPIVCDFLVLGSGIAGLSFALDASAHGEVVIVTKRARDESNTKYAQGGIASVLGQGDTFAAHVADTMASGAGLCHDVVV